MDTVGFDDTIEKMAKAFEDMARVIRLNKDQPFGGAVVIIAPGSNAKIAYIQHGEVMEGNFWGGLGNEIASKVRDIEAKAIMQRPYLR